MTADLEPLLAQANLHRMRGQWIEAEARCVEVMRADPNNVHAHSLLGDILRDQGRLDDAAQWYQMALDLNPDSDADKAKLSSVESARAQLEAPRARRASSHHGTQKLLGVAPTDWLRALWLVIALFVVVVAAVLATRGPTRPQQSFVPTGTMKGLPGATAAGLPRGVAAGPAGSPAQSSPAQSSAPQGAGPAGIQARSGSPPAGGAPGSGASSDRETKIEQDLGRSLAAERDFSLGAVVLVSRDEHAVVTLGVQLPAGTDPAVARDYVVGRAFQAGITTFYADPAVAHVTVSVRAGSSAGAPVPVFEGDLDRQTAVALAASSRPLSAEQMLGAFQRPWVGTLGPAPR